MSSKRQQRKFKIAPISKKIKAFITDMFMVYMPLLYIIAYLFMGGKDAFLASEFAPLLGVILYGLIVAFLESRFGQTPGKKAYNLKLVHAITGENITFLHAFFRFIGFLFSATILLGLVVPFFRKDRKTLHDFLATTIVIVLKDEDAI